MGGHYDCFGEGAVDGFLSLQHGGGADALGNQRLVLGPWAHTGLGADGVEQGELVYPENSLYPYRQMRWRWWDRWLKGEPNGVDEEPPVEYYLMGDVDDPSSAGNVWIQADDWPPADVAFEAMYLHPSGALLFAPPSGSGGTSSYVFDPNDPVPTLGGRNLNIPAGPYDQRPLDWRPDQLVFTGAVLTHPVIVVGKVVGRVFASSTAPDTDFTIKLVDVYPDGREMLVTDGILRGRFRNGFESESFLTPDSVYAFDVDLWSTALAFDVGHRIQVIVSSSNSPRFGVNPNDGRPFNSPHLPTICTNTVHMTPEHPSHIILPVSRPAVATPDLAAGDPLIRLSGGGKAGRRFRFRLEMPRGDAVDLGVYSATGRLVRWIRRGFLPEGIHDLEWDGRSGRSVPATPGVYFLRLQSAAGYVANRKLVLCR
jgi:putative CocE/NonD family hydrolase